MALAAKNNHNITAKKIRQLSMKYNKKMTAG